MRNTYLAITLASGSVLYLAWIGIVKTTESTEARETIKQAVELPSEGHCKLAEYMMNNSRYYTASNLRKAGEISKQCQAIDDKKPQ